MGIEMSSWTFTPSRSPSPHNIRIIQNKTFITVKNIQKVTLYRLLIKTSDFKTILKTSQLLHDAIFIGSLVHTLRALQQSKGDVRRDFVCCCTSRCCVKLVKCVG